MKCLGASTLTGVASAANEIVDLTIAATPFEVAKRKCVATSVNGTVPGPLLRFRQGQNAVLQVTNRLHVPTSIHWHGVLLPHEMDGVPGVSFPGIAPGQTFTYRFPIQQSGTYWYHSHSGGQEQTGLYGPLILDPVEPEPFSYEREYVVMLADWSFAGPEAMLDRLKKQSDYYNYQRRTTGEFFRDAKAEGLGKALDQYSAWAKMRMDAADLLDVTSAGYKYLMNGKTAEDNWTAIFKPGERVRLRFVQVGAMTFQDLRIPGLRMRLVQTDGQNLQPVEVDEIRMGPGETYDVIVEPKEDRAYTIFAETLDRSGFARGTLAPRAGMSAAIPERRKRPLRSMADMGMEMGKQGMAGKTDMAGKTAMAGMTGMATMPGMTGMNHEMRPAMSHPVKHGADHHGAGNQSTPMMTKPRLDEPGIGLGHDGRRVLLYSDLKSLRPLPDQRMAMREMEIHLTGHMERFMWSFDGKKYSQSREPIHFVLGERLRWIFVNDTMMEHTIHLHGMWMQVENGAGNLLPRKHTVLVKPAERMSVLVTADAPGDWAFHCHLPLHMAAGMFRVVRVSERKS